MKLSEVAQARGLFRDGDETFQGNAIERGGRECLLPVTRSGENLMAEGAAFPALRGALEFLLEHHRQPLDVSSLAIRCGVPVRCLRSQFKRVLGITPMECLIRIRVERAMRLLVESDRQIQDIAVEVGFYDHSSLNRHFVRMVGVAPSLCRIRKHARIFSRLLRP
ncbi:AraC family transcriptional regulator [Luteolibacter sp. LG18]|uniref:AraC family transcriptional regulator n=1 Tax=Luteolibacter sp. LG18 TaxID=2819286 RepID=UPI002B2B4A67|nr:hypothetical protein llg_31110 [Luteolibacter sp. LG18]